MSFLNHRILAAALFVVAVLALAVPAWVVTHPPAIPHVAKPVRPVAVVPPDVLPPVEPVQYQELSRDDAQVFNASIPFSDAPNPPARPFTFYGSSDDRARARDCLAAAVWYEAGDDAVGEKAVAQVVLNRVRHPAFPHTVCGVVFQGSERHTGCQFTFTCDGALVRVPSPAAWDRARAVAAAALSGSVDKPVGTATHYHTDWVVPYWSSSLDKIAEVHTHLFFRWTGWWGTPAAFRNRQAGAEPAIRQLAALSPAHAGAMDLVGDGGPGAGFDVAALNAAPRRHAGGHRQRRCGAPCRWRARQLRRAARPQREPGQLSHAGCDHVRRTLALQVHGVDGRAVHSRHAQRSPRSRSARWHSACCAIVPPVSKSRCGTAACSAAWRPATA